MAKPYTAFTEWMKQQGFVPEHKFHPVRRWRMDYAHIERMICLEIQGGLWITGRHNTGAGMTKDIEKFNAATLLGWTLIFCTPAMVKSGEACHLVSEILKDKRINLKDKRINA